MADNKTSSSIELKGNLIFPTSQKIDYNPAVAFDTTGTGEQSSATVDANTVGYGSALHMDTDGNYIEADASAATTMPCSALALETSTGTKNVLLKGYFRNDAWNWTPGATIYVSTTVGTFTETAPSGSGDQVQIIGIAITADIIQFNPSYDLIEIV